MTANEVSNARRKWQKERAGTSPLAGSRKAALDDLVEKGKMIRDVIAVFDNGILLAGYRDHQNRHAGLDYDAPAFIPIAEFAEKHGIAPVSARQKAQRGGYMTAKKMGRDWMIDKDEPHTDLRKTAPTEPTDAAEIAETDLLVDDNNDILPDDDLITLSAAEFEKFLEELGEYRKIGLTPREIATLKK